MPYYDEACKNIDKKINDMASQLLLAMSNQNRDSIKTRLGKFLSECTEVVDYLSFENTGLIDDDKRTIIKELVYSSIIDMQLDTFLSILSMLMSLVDDTSYTTVFLRIPTCEKSQASECLNYYILKERSIEKSIVSLTRIAVTSRGEKTLDEYSKTSKWKKRIEKALDVQVQISNGIKLPQVQEGKTLFPLLLNIDKRTKIPVWQEFLADVRNLPYMDDFLRLIVFTQFQAKRTLTESEMENLARDYAASVKRRKSL